MWGFLFWIHEAAAATSQDSLQIQWPCGPWRSSPSCFSVTVSRGALWNWFQAFKGPLHFNKVALMGEMNNTNISPVIYFTMRWTQWGVFDRVWLIQYCTGCKTFLFEWAILHLQGTWRAITLNREAQNRSLRILLNGMKIRWRHQWRFMPLILKEFTLSVNVSFLHGSPAGGNYFLVSMIWWSFASLYRWCDEVSAPGRDKVHLTWLCLSQSVGWSG